jgi:hypothetical protein
VADGDVFFSGAITAGVVYVASYHTNVSHFSADLNYFATAGVNNPPLQALSNGVNGGNGVYAYSSASTFPNNTYSSDQLLGGCGVFACANGDPGIDCGGGEQPHRECRSDTAVYRHRDL